MPYDLADIRRSPVIARLAAAQGQTGAIGTAPPRRPGIFRRIFGRKRPSTYQRCLAVHLHFATPRSALHD